VHRILLVVSELTDLQPMWIQRYFDQVAAGTAAAGARLEIESQAPEFTCRGCNAVFHVSLRTVDQVTCPECGSAACTLTKLPDYVVEEIEVS